MKHVWLYISQDDLKIEKAQCLEEGKDISSLEGEFDRLMASDLDSPVNQKAAQDLLDKTIGLAVRADFRYEEPSTLEGIKSTRSADVKLPALGLSEDELYDKVYGAWLGRCCGCLLGKPVESWKTPKLTEYMKETNNYPLSYYLGAELPQDALDKFEVKHGNKMWAEEIECMVEDDDTNYTTIGMAIVKNHGKNFTPTDVANFWLQNVPILHTCTAERVAYRNFTLEMDPPASASYRNVYREWIGAQIRADFFGYAAPGNPALAAEFAWRDASISHVKNGIYGEMWVAAMLAAAFVTDDIKTVIKAGLAEIPQDSRLADAIRDLMFFHSSGKSYDDAVAKLHKEWDENNPHHWCHTISNAIVVVIGLLWGEADYEKSITRAVMPGFDTDCNGATVGSIVGVVLGAKKLPSKWISPINDTLHTGVAGYNVVKISDMAKETIEIIAALAKTD